MINSVSNMCTGLFVVVAVALFIFVVVVWL